MADPDSSLCIDELPGAYKLEFHGTDTDTDFRDAPIE